MKIKEEGKMKRRGPSWLNPTPQNVAAVKSATESGKPSTKRNHTIGGSLVNYITDGERN